MPARATVTLFHVRGIRIGVDYSWFFVLFLLIWWLSTGYRDVLGVSNSDPEPYLLALVGALAFFGSILLHELGHAFVAIHRGIPISDITLWMFGGVARMTRDADSPGTEFKIAIAGPLVTLAIALVCAVAGGGGCGRVRWGGGGGGGGRGGVFGRGGGPKPGRRHLRSPGAGRLAF